jgi:hypothetical protein
MQKTKIGFGVGAAVVLCAVMYLGFAGASSRGVRHVPQVRLISPESESVVTLSSGQGVEFSWKPTPYPAGGRIAYKFTLYRGFGYDSIVDMVLGENVYSVNVPFEKFESGDYVWQVRQRDEQSGDWSIPERWSFKIEK